MSGWHFQGLPKAKSSVFNIGTVCISRSRTVQSNSKRALSRPTSPHHLQSRWGEVTEIIWSTRVKNIHSRLCMTVLAVRSVSLLSSYKQKYIATNCSFLVRKNLILLKYVRQNEASALPPRFPYQVLNSYWG